MEYLIQMNEKSSDRGSVPKSSFLINNELCLVKDNNIECYEAFSEALGCRIFKFMGDYPVVDYFLINGDLFEAHMKMTSHYKYVCYSKKYKYRLNNFFKELSYLGDFVPYVKKNRSKLNIEQLFKYFKLDFNQVYFMLVVDAVIGNRDRHLNNFDIYYDEDNEVRLAPILDFGQSMLFCFSDSYLSNAMSLDSYEFDVSAPFCETHREQLSFLKETYGVRKVLKSDYESFKNFIMNENEDLFLHYLV